MGKIEDVLLDIGFDAQEIRTYLALIRSNTRPAFQVSQETRIDRTTTYDILERLITKGVVSVITKNGTKHFTALNAKTLLLHFKHKLSALENMLPDLNRLSTGSEALSCELFQGRDGLKTVLKDLLASNQNYLVIGIRREYEEILGYFNDQGVLQLDRSRIREQAIVEKSSRFTRVRNGTYRFVEKKLLSPNTTLIYGNTVVFFVWTEPYYAIRVQNKAFAKGQAEYFEMLWDIAKPGTQTVTKSLTARHYGRK